MTITYDTGALIAADRGERRMWVRHRALLSQRVVPTVPAPVLAQGWRGDARQALLAKLLSGCDVEPLDERQARSAGALAARAGSSDIVDATTVEGALRRHDLVITSDAEDLRRIASASNRRLEVEAP